MQGQPLVAIFARWKLDGVAEIATAERGLGVAFEQALAGAGRNVALGLECLVALDAKEGRHYGLGCGQRLGWWWKPPS